MSETEMVQQFQRGMSCAYEDVIRLLDTVVKGFPGLISPEHQEYAGVFSMLLEEIRHEIDAKRQIIEQATMSAIAASLMGKGVQ